MQELCSSPEECEYWQPACNAIQRCLKTEKVLLAVQCCLEVVTGIQTAGLCLLGIPSWVFNFLCPVLQFADTYLSGKIFLLRFMCLQLPWGSRHHCPFLQ